MTLPLLFPFSHLIYFAPFLVITFYHFSLRENLWWALLCGFIIDLFSSSTHLGFFALNYCLTTLFLSRYTSYFFEDRLSTLPLMTACFAGLSTLLNTLLLSLMGKQFLFSLEGLFFQIGIIPLQTGLYAILFFILPLKIIKILNMRYRMRRRKRS